MTDWLDDRIGAITVQDNGEPLPRKKALNLIGATVAENVAENRIDVTIPTAIGAGAGLADRAALRALDSAERIHRQRRVVADSGDGKPAAFVWLADEGIGTSDDGLNVLKPEDVLTASAGRWYREPQVSRGARYGTVVLEKIHFDVTEYGAIGNGLADDTAAFQSAAAAAIAAHGEMFIPAGTYKLTAGITIDGSCTIRGAPGNVIVPALPDIIGTSVGHRVFNVAASDVTIDGLAFDYEGLETGNEETRYLLWAAGANDSSHIARVTFRGCRVTNFRIGDYPSSLKVGHFIFVTWVDDLLVENCYADNVSGFGIFVEACAHPIIRRNQLSTGWGAITLNSGLFGGVIEANRITGADDLGHRLDEGGAIDIPSTPSQGFGPNTRLAVRNNYVSGFIQYGNALRVGSSDYVDVDANVFDDLSSPDGGLQAYVAFSTRSFQDSCHQIRIRGNTFIAGDVLGNTHGQTAIQVDNQDWHATPLTATLTFAASGNTITRSSGDFLADNYQPGMRVIVSGSVSNNGTYTVIGSVTSTVLTVAGPLVNETHSATLTPDYDNTLTRAAGFIIADNQFLSADEDHSFTAAIVVHGQTGGIDDVNIHDNIGSGRCLAGAPVAGFCTVIAAITSSITNVKIHHNVWTLVGTTDSNQIGVYIGQAADRVVATENVADTFSFPIQNGSSGTELVFNDLRHAGASSLDVGPYSYTIKANGHSTVFGSDASTTLPGALTTGGDLTHVGDTYENNAKTHYAKDASGAYRIMSRTDGSNLLRFGTLGVGFRFESKDLAAVLASISEAGLVTLGVGGDTTTVHQVNGKLSVASSVTCGDVVSSGDVYRNNSKADYYKDSGGTYRLIKRGTNANALQYGSLGAGHTFYNVDLGAAKFTIAEDGTITTAGDIFHATDIYMAYNRTIYMKDAGGSYRILERGAVRGSLGGGHVWKDLDIANTLMSLSETGLLTVGQSGDTTTKHRINGKTQTTVGAAGGATAIPASPDKYLVLNLGGTDYAIPAFAVA